MATLDIALDDNANFAGSSVFAVVEKDDDNGRVTVDEDVVRVGVPDDVRAIGSIADLTLEYDRERNIRDSMKQLNKELSRGDVLDRLGVTK